MVPPSTTKPFLPPSLKAVLFDFDGVLAMTIEDNYEAWRRVFSRIGVSLDRTEYMLMEGRKASEIVFHFLEKSGVDQSKANGLVEQKHEEYAAISNFKLYEGVPLIIEKLRASNVRLGLVSGGSKKRILATFPEGLMAQFDVLVSGDDIKESKPSPVPYLAAADKIGASAEECLVVENAPLGIKSARAAGMKCVAITSTLDQSHLGEADAIFGSIGELTQLI